MRKTIVIVTHDMAEAFALGTRVGVLADGVLAALDDAADDRAIAAIRGCGRCSSRCSRPPASLRGRRQRMTLLHFWRTHAASSARCSASTSCWLASRRWWRSSPACRSASSPRAVRALGAPIVWLANVVQTIPSLAMFGFLLPLPFVGGLGARVAIFVLILYALLPIMRTTMAGLRSVDRVARRGRHGAWA